MLEPSLDIELCHILEITAFDLLFLIRGVPQLPPLHESKSMMLPDAYVLCRINCVSLILFGDLGFGRSLEAHVDLEVLMFG